MLVRFSIAFSIATMAFCAAHEQPGIEPAGAICARAADASIDKAKKAEFLMDRKENLMAAASPQWSGWLRELSDSTSLDTRAWAMARRLEAGDFSCYLAYETIIFDHVMAISRTGYSAGKLKSRSPHPKISDDENPLYIDSKSVFWKSLEKTIRADAKLGVTAGHYSIWCFNTRPEHRELILDLAKHVEKSWKDPRFWIIMDWLYSWGVEEDFAKVLESLPLRSRSTFERLFKDAKKLPGFLNSPVALQARQDEEALKTSENDSAAGGNDKSAAVSEDKIADLRARSPKTKSMSTPLSYPAEAKNRGLIAELSLEMVVREDGSPKSCRPLPGPWLAFFAPSGIKYAMGYKFEPMPYDFRFLLNVHFKL
jgi:hypothetical protein